MTEGRVQFPAYEALSLEHLQAELARIDVLIQRQVRRWSRRRPRPLTLLSPPPRGGWRPWSRWPKASVRRYAWYG